MADATKAAELRVGVSFEAVPDGGVLRAFVGFPARSQRRRAWCRAAEPTASRFCRSLTMRASRSTSARSELRPDADRAVASAVPGLRFAGRSWCAASSGRLLRGAQGHAYRLRECRCSEALAEALARLEHSAG
jgi:hypothetical protein